MYICVCRTISTIKWQHWKGTTFPLQQMHMQVLWYYKLKVNNNFQMVNINQAD